MGKELREGNRGRWGKGEWLREGKGGMGKGGEKGKGGKRGKGIRVGKGGKVKGGEKG